MENDKKTISRAISEYFLHVYNNCSIGYAQFTYNHSKALEKYFNMYKPLSELSFKLVYDYIKSEQARGIKNSTINKRVGILRRAVKFGAFPGDLSDFSLLRAQFTTYGRLNALERAKVDNIIRFFPLHETLVYNLFKDTGILISELLNIKVGDVSLKHNKILIEQTKTRPARYVFIKENTKKLISKYMMTRRLKNTSSLLFPKYNKEHNKINGLFRKIKDASGVKTITPHRLRSTLASELYANGHDVSYITKALGDLTIDITKRYIFIDDNGDDVSLALYEKIHDQTSHSGTQ